MTNNRAARSEIPIVRIRLETMQLRTEMCFEIILIRVTFDEDRLNRRHFLVHTRNAVYENTRLNAQLGVRKI